MPSVYNEDNFIGRVNYAAQCLVRRSGIGSRHYDTCFEMADGDAVVTALLRRAEKNARLKTAIQREYRIEADGKDRPGLQGYPSSWQQAATALAHITTRDLPYEARQQRARFHEKYWPEPTYANQEQRPPC